MSTKWLICLGSPYGTSYWQAGDAAEQNGSLKMAWYGEKGKLHYFKEDHGLPITLTSDDIMLLINYAWHANFAQKQQTESNSSPWMESLK